MIGTTSSGTLMVLLGMYVLYIRTPDCQLPQWADRGAIAVTSTHDPELIGAVGEVVEMAAESLVG